MEQILSTIIAYLLANGGPFGVVLALALAYISYKEYVYYKFIKKKEDDEKSTEDEIKTSHNKVVKKISDLTSSIDEFIEINKENSKKIEKLEENIKELNDERIAELKELLNNYNKTMNELSLAIEKIKFLVQNKKDTFN